LFQEKTRGEGKEKNCLWSGVHANPPIGGKGGRANLAARWSVHEKKGRGKKWAGGVGAWVENQRGKGKARGGCSGGSVTCLVQLPGKRSKKQEAPAVEKEEGGEGVGVLSS